MLDNKGMFLGGFLIGIAARTLYPWIMNKRKEPFKLKFLFEPLLTGVLGVGATISAVPSSGGEPMSYSLMGFGFGYAGQDVVREVKKATEGQREGGE